MIKLAIAFFVWLHNISYTMISSLVVRENRGIHPKHRILNYEQFFVNHINSDDRVLDVGCGNGHVAYKVASKAKEVVGIDIAVASIRLAKRKFKKDNITYLTGDATTYPFLDKFDVIILSNTLEHIQDRHALLEKLRVRAPKILIRVPLLTRDWLPVYKKEHGFEYRLDPTHYIEFTEEIFRDELTQAGWQIEDLQTKFGELYAVVKW